MYLSLRHNRWSRARHGRVLEVGELKAMAKAAADRKKAHERDLALLVEGVRQILRRTAERDAMEELLRDNPYSEEAKVQVAWAKVDDDEC
jgi:hypothetical protein